MNECVITQLMDKMTSRPNALDFLTLDYIAVSVQDDMT